MEKIIYYGHSTIGLEIGESLSIIDPFFEGNPATSLHAKDVAPQNILITHGHADHFGDTLEIYNAHKSKVIANFEIIEYLLRLGVENAHSQHIGGSFEHGFAKVKLTNALHGSMLDDGTDGGNPVGFIITLPSGKKVYAAGDTGLFGDMRLIGEEGIDVALLPIGDNYTMGPDDAIRAVKMIAPKIVIPIHYNTWPLIAQDPYAWATRVREETDAKPVVLTPGESLTL